MAVTGKVKRQSAKPAKSGLDLRGGIKLTAFSRGLLREWRKLHLPTTNAGVVVAVSGGADSTALLLALDELVKSKTLKIKVFVAHLNHRLRGVASQEDARWVTTMAKRLGHEIAVGSVDVKKRATRTRDNLEQAARRARYEFLAKTTRSKGAKLILTAHTMDDQAETILLNLLRGSGADGLGGIEPVRPLIPGGETTLARPLLSWARRHDTEDYCRLRGIEVRIDNMNADEQFARVRVRRQLLPLMKTFNPKLVEGLARTAELLREDSTALDGAAARLLELATELSPEGEGVNTALRLDLLSSAHPALRRRALRQWIRQCRGDLKRLERTHVIAVESLLFGERGGRVVELPGGSTVSRKRGLLRFER